MVVIAASWKEFQKIDGECRQDTHSQHTSVQYSPFTSAERIARAWLKNCSVIFVRLKRICHLVRTCLTLCCSLTCRIPRAHHLPHSLFLLPRHQNTHNDRDNTIFSKNTYTVYRLSRTLSAFGGPKKNHLSGPSTFFTITFS